MSEAGLTIRQGWPANLPQLARFLDQNKVYDTITLPLLEEKLFHDPHADPELCFSAIIDGKLTGFLYAVRRSVRNTEPGYVKLFAVDKAFRRQKIGSRLFTMAEKILSEKGADCIRWYDVPLNYLMPGIDPRYTEAYCFALAQGFKQTGEAINMIVDLNAMDWDTRKEENSLHEKGVTIRRAKVEDREDLRALLSPEWELWNNEVDMAMKDDPPSVHIAFKEGSLKAFSVHNGNNKGTGWFGPMGTHADMRGLGVGSVLLKRCLNDMFIQGFKTAVIPWVGPVSFYAHFAKATINRVFWRMEKPLNKS